MRILFDHQVFSWQTYGGISRYFVEQMRELQALGQMVYLPQHFFSENVYLSQFPAFDRKSFLPFSVKGKKWLQLQLGKWSSARALKSVQPDVFHPTYFDPYFFAQVNQLGVPWVVTVHDMIHEIYGHGSRGFFSLDKDVIANKKFLAEKAGAIITVSASTRADLLKYCPGVDPGKVHVVHHGNRLLANEVSSPLNDGQYLLFVGQRKGYKNFSQMLEQISVVLQETPGLQLFCVGGSPFSSEELENIARLRLQGRVQYKMVESDEALTNIYQHAVCFIFPSQYEGFGLPVIEAMACNCPVVLNQASSLPEVGGDAAVYFNSADAVSLPNAVFRLLRDDALRSSMIEKGRTRAAQFTWKKSAEAHLKIYQSLLA